MGEITISGTLPSAISYCNFTADLFIGDLAYWWVPVFGGESSRGLLHLFIVGRVTVVDTAWCRHIQLILSSSRVSVLHYE
jgi:hypothetical protein